MNIASADHLEIPEDFTDGQKLPDGFFEEHESGSQEDENTVEDYDSQYQIEQQYEGEIGVDQLMDAYDDDILPYSEDQLIAQAPFMSLLHDINECAVKIVYKYNISAEIKAMSEIVADKEYLEKLENGNITEVREQISDAITPMFQKMMNQTGQEIVSQMPPELIDWFKDTTIVVVKHGGQVEGYQFSMSDEELEGNRDRNPQLTNNSTNSSEVISKNTAENTVQNEGGNITQSDLSKTNLTRNQTLQKLLDQIQALYPNATINRSDNKNKIDITLEEEQVKGNDTEIEVPVSEESTSLDDNSEEEETEEPAENEDEEKNVEIIQVIDDTPTAAHEDENEHDHDDDDEEVDSKSVNISINIDINTNQDQNDQVEEGQSNLEEIQEEVEEEVDEEEDLDLDNWVQYPENENVDQVKQDVQDEIDDAMQNTKDQSTKYKIETILIDEDFNSDEAVDKINDIIDKNGADYYNGYRNNGKASYYKYYKTTGYYTGALGDGYYKKVDDTGYYQPKIKYKTQAEYMNREQYRVVTVSKKRGTFGQYIEKSAKDWFNWTMP